MCPPAALPAGLRLLCCLLQQWEQLPAGAAALTGWLLGEAESGHEASGLQDEEDFLFEKGDLNLWAEPVQWVRLLHQHLCCLVESLRRGCGAVGPELEQQFRRLSAQAEAGLLRCQQGLAALPALPRFSCTGQHQALLLGHHRASLALDVLDRLWERS